jgi:hypothetical protein
MGDAFLQFGDTISWGLISQRRLPFKSIRQAELIWSSTSGHRYVVMGWLAGEMRRTCRDSGSRGIG